MTQGDKIRQAREIRALTQEDLAKKIGRSNVQIAQVERGFREPSQELLEAIALATRFPLTFFASPPHIEFPISDVIFRAKVGISRKKMLAAVRYAEHIFGIAHALAKGLKRIPVLIQSLSTNPVSAAKQTRQLMKVGPDEPLLNLVRALERAGVWCFALPELEDGDAFCVWLQVEEYDIPIIAVSAKAPADRLRLSVAHELGHLVLHRGLVTRPRKEIEQEAFTFGAEFCLPARAMEQELVGPITLTALARLKLRWGISIAALIRRSHELQLITTRQYHYLFQQLSIKGWRTHEPEQLNIPVERPRLLRNMAELVYGFPINYSRFAAEARVSEQELRSIMALYADRKELAKEDLPPKGKVMSFPKGVLESV
ncbi:MAG: XRE family transcriptional regulator [Acidobacteria bacterium]|nr:XRE family transcriptional regulator [Acidobacteriota bacterium]